MCDKILCFLLAVFIQIIGFDKSILFENVKVIVFYVIDKAFSESCLANARLTKQKYIELIILLKGFSGKPFCRILAPCHVGRQSGLR